MAPSSHLPVPLLLLLLLLCCHPAEPAATAASSAYYSFPVFDGKSTADGVVVTTDSAMLAPATFLFDAKFFPEFNRSQGYVLLSRPVALWRPTANGTREEASFNTSFAVDVGEESSTTGAVAFVVLLDSFPPLRGNSHGPRATVVDSVNLSAAAPNATNGVVAVEVGAVSSYGPRSPAVGLNVTITPNRSSAAAQLAVRIAYDAAAHRLSVYVDDAAAGEPGLNSTASTLLEAPLDLAGRLPTQAALVGFFADTVRDVVAGVRGWELTVDGLREDEADGHRHPGQNDDDSASSPSMLVILVAVMGSVAAVAILVVAVLLYIAVSRRRAHDKELQECYTAYFARTTRI